ncbi:MAG: tryptophan synthase subunit alpha [Microscillaceae bacterium]|jgi:tryptophan synthase alpha chain|nr:tryptophan synthase subunit alpha [Microscillaceae bacterium]
MIQNRLTKLFQTSQQNILTIYFTAGFPQLRDTQRILEALEQSGADIIEIGMPFSDPIADGEVIQMSNQQALENGMTIAKMFEQIANFRQKIKIPVLLMGYLNPVLQFGMERFCQTAAQVGIDGFILPDLPLNEYLSDYKSLWDAHNLSNVFLITPQTPESRIRMIDEVSEGFIYAVSTSSTTGKTSAISASQTAYFARLQALNLKNPFLIGFGISDKASFRQACTHARGAIIGSAFIKMLQNSQDLPVDIANFVQKIKS